VRLHGLRPLLAIAGMAQQVGLRGDDGHRRSQFVRRVLHEGLFPLHALAQLRQQVVQRGGQRLQFSMARLDAQR
jgi:hypothetical protein